MSENYERNAVVLRVVDGDTMDLLIDLGYRQFTNQRVRLAHVDTPETFGVKKTSEEYAAGTAAKDYVNDWLESTCEKDDFGRPIVVVKSLEEEGKFGRWIVEICNTNQTQQLNNLLLQEGHADPY